MNVSEKLDQMFSEFISGGMPLKIIKELKDSITPDDVDLLMEKVIALKDPSEYCKNDYDDKTVTGFFLFIDAVSALIINLGYARISKTKKYEQSSHPFVPWVVKYAQDARFHKEILNKFDNLFLV